MFSLMTNRWRKRLSAHKAISRINRLIRQWISLLFISWFNKYQIFRTGLTFCSFISFLMTLFLIDLKNLFIRDIVLDLIYNNIIDTWIEIMDTLRNMKKLWREQLESKRKQWGIGGKQLLNFFSQYIVWKINFDQMLINL